MQMISSFFKKVLSQIKAKVTKDEDRNKLHSIFQMHLFVTFPNCPLRVVDKMIELQLGVN